MVTGNSRRVFRGNAYGSIAALAAFTLVQLVVSKPIALLVLGVTPFVGLALPEKLVLDVQGAGTPSCAA